MNLYIPLVKHHLNKNTSLVSLDGISKLQLFNSVGNSTYFLALTEKKTYLHILVRFLKKINGIDLSFSSLRNIFMDSTLITMNPLSSNYYM